MTKLRELYKCDICGNVTEIVNEGAPALVCCNQPMMKLEAKSEDQGQEKHVPVIKDTECCIIVDVGEVSHPMEEKHYIKFIEVLTKNSVLRCELSPGEAPSAKFCIDKSEVIEVREYCTIHGLWKKLS
ncbi:MAG: desulfoferrodoxin [Candidatus Theseobacter exili]|nr:desulfoferrodoxin [Candidatus Theseobacter exili]